MKHQRRKWRALKVCWAALAVLLLASCAQEPRNLVTQREEAERVVNLFSPMEKTDQIGRAHV